MKNILNYGVIAKTILKEQTLLLNFTYFPSVHCVSTQRVVLTSFHKGYFTL